MNFRKVVGVIDEDPFHPRTWSGSSAYFFKEMNAQGALLSAISAQPPKLTQYLYKFLTFQPRVANWKFKYHLSLEYYEQMTRAARHALDQIDPGEYDVIMQVGAWYDLTGYKNKPVVSYHDGNLATRLKSPYGYPKINDDCIARTLAHERDLYRRINLIFPMSEWLGSSFIHDFGVSAKKVFPVGAGINLPRVVNVTDKSYEKPRILFVGKDFKRKGGEDILAAFQIVKKKINKAELTIIWPQLESAPEGIRALGYISKTTEDGINQLLDEYQRATIFVLPSLYEPFGISFVEAMAHKLPCIGTNLCAMPEIIKDGETGYLVPPGNPHALAGKILHLLSEPECCRQFGEAGYKHYISTYTWQAVTSKICHVIKERLE